MGSQWVTSVARIISGDVTAIIGMRVYLYAIQKRFSEAFQVSSGRGITAVLAFAAAFRRAALRVLAGQTEAAKSAGEEALRYSRRD